MDYQNNNYFIKEDYVSRSIANTYVADPNDYWTKKRISRSKRYQYHVYKKAIQVISSIRNCSFVDIGCGYPKKIELLIAPIISNITLIDQPSMASVINRDFPQWKFIPLNLEQCTSTHYGSFDCIVCSDVIEHLINPDPVLKLIRNIIKPNGIIIISTPERDILRGVNCLKSPHKEHVREWNTTEFIKYLTHSGLEIIDHKLLPQAKLTIFEDTLFKFISPPETPRYSGNQMVICKKYSK